MILGLNMSGRGGQSCLQEMLAMEPLAKVLAASGYPADVTAAKIARQGAAGFPRKPYFFKETQNKIREVLA